MLPHMTRLVVVLLAALTLASCGGGDESSSSKERSGGEEDSAAQPTTPAPSATPPSSGGGGSSARARYIARVDAICRAANQRLAPIRAKIATVDNGRRGKGEVFAQFRDLTGQAASISGGVLGQIEDVPPPAPDRAEIERIEALIERQVRLLNSLAAAAGRRDVNAIKRLNGRITAVNATYRSAARAYGFKHCGQSG